MDNQRSTFSPKKVTKKSKSGVKSLALLQSPFIHWTIKVLFGLVILVLTGSLTAQKYRTYHIKVDEIAQEEIIAPFTFPVLKPDDVLAKDIDEAVRQTSSIVDRDTLLAQQTISEIDLFFADVESYIANIEANNDVPLDSLFKQDAELFVPISKMRGEFSDSTVYTLIDQESRTRLKMLIKATLDSLFNTGIVADKGIFNNDLNKKVTIDNGKTRREIPLASIYDRDEAFEKIVSLAANHIESRPRFRTSFVEITMSFVVPNLFLNQEKTTEVRAQAERDVSRFQGSVFKGEIILRPHDKVTSEHMIKIRSLEAANPQKALEESTISLFLPLIGRFLAVALIISLLAFYIFYFNPKLFYDNFHLLAITVIIVLMLLIVYFVHVVGDLSIYLIPFATGGMLLCILFDSKLALRIVLTISLLAAIMLDFDFFIFFFAVVSGTVGVYSVSKVRRRSEFYRSLYLIPIANVIIIFTLTSTMSYIGTRDFFYLLMLGALNGVLAPVLTIGLMPIFESIFRISTDITLLELSDSNHPLLRQLALQAPGSFHHSLVVGNLSEAAAESIGANSLFVRVASYYHDIGKMMKPEYFVENQRGGYNPHDKLNPTMSALILKSHVKDGIRMATEHRLPKEVIDMIPQHHGTSLISFFYHKAKKEDPDTTLTERDFRYDGPKPQTKEAGIIMLADSVEAVSRVLKDPTPSRLRGMVREITMNKFNARELDECELTLKDLNKIGEAFLHILTGIFHHRVEYPSNKPEQKQSKKPAPETEQKQNPKPKDDKEEKDEDISEQAETVSPAE